MRGIIIEPIRRNQSEMPWYWRVAFLFAKSSFRFNAEDHTLVRVRVVLGRAWVQRVPCETVGVLNVSTIHNFMQQLISEPDADNCPCPSCTMLRHRKMPNSGVPVA